jgi:hypothetical protein
MMLGPRTTTTHQALPTQEGKAQQSSHGERTTTQTLARVGAVAALVGSVVLFVSTLLHPLGSDPNDPPAAFAEYAADSHWVWSHLGQFLGFALLGMALVALAGTLEPGRPAAWARIGLAATAAMIAMAAALQAVDGVALKVMVDRWAAATGDARMLAYEAAFAVRQVEIGLASLLSLVSGLTLTVFGVARCSQAPGIPAGSERSVWRAAWARSWPG